MVTVRTSSRLSEFVAADIERFESLPLQPPQKPDTKTKRVRVGPMYKPPPPPRYVLAWQWFGRRILYGGPVRSWVMKRSYVLRWLHGMVPQVAKFLHAILGPRVSEIEYQERMLACNKCDMRVIQIQRIKEKDRVSGTVRTKEYCGGCGCGQWHMSELKRKNALANWRCPMRKHPGNYGDELYASLLKPTF